MPVRFIIALCRFSAITMCVSIIGAILYNGFHPHSHPGIVTIVLIFLSVALAIVLIRLPLKLTITKRTVFFLAATAFALRLFAIVSINNAQVSDFKIFDELARALNHGHGFSYTDSAGLSEAALFLNKCDRSRPGSYSFPASGFSRHPCFTLFNYRRPCILWKNPQRNPVRDDRLCSLSSC